MAAAELLDVRVVAAASEQDRLLAFGGLLVEACATCAPRAPFRPCSLSLEDDGVRLVPTDAPPVGYEHARSVDVLVDDWRGVASDVDATTLLERGWMDAHFPTLRRRTTTVEECVREVQLRRVTEEWCLEGFEDGRNASSLGLSVLLALTLRAAWGLDVRVFAAATWAACVGVARRDDATWVLYDPSRTRCNGFDALAARPRAPLHRPPPCSGEFILVRARTVWHVASVGRVYRGVIEAYLFALRRRRRRVSLLSHAWRPLSTADSDVQAILRRCLREERDDDGRQSRKE